MCLPKFSVIRTTVASIPVHVHTNPAHVQAISTQCRQNSEAVPLPALFVSSNSQIIVKVGARLR